MSELLLEPLSERARRAVIQLPVDCLTFGEILKIERDGQERRRENRLHYDRNDFARDVAHLASDRRAARVRAALDSLQEELAAALSIAEVGRLLDVAFEATQ